MQQLHFSNDVTKKEPKGWEQSLAWGSGSGHSCLDKLLPHLLRNHFFLSNNYRLPQDNLTSLMWYDGEEINNKFVSVSFEGHLQQCVHERTVSEAGVYDRCPEVGGMKPAVRSYSNTCIHKTELLFCPLFSDILSNTSQWELMYIEKSAGLGATRLKEHFLHIFTLEIINCLGNKTLEPASQSSFWISAK